MTTILIAAVNPDTSEPLNGGYVSVRLVDAGSGGATGEQVITGTQRVKLDDAGEASIDLVPNDEITPAGTHYAFTVDGSSPATVRTIEVPDSVTPVSWADESIQVVTSVPPVKIPAAASGNPGDVVTINETGDGYDVAAPSGGADSSVALTPGSAGAFRTTTTAEALAGGLVAFGASEDAASAAAAVLDQYVVTDGRATQIGVNNNASTFAIYSLAQALVAQQAAGEAPGYASAAVAEALDYFYGTTLALSSPDPVMELCNDWDEGTATSGAYLTPAAGEFTTGVYWRYAITPLPLVGYPDPEDGDLVYSELDTQPRDGVGEIDNREKALQREYDAAAGRWRIFKFLEWTPEGFTSEQHSLNTGFANEVDGVTYYYELPEGIETEFSAHLDFSNGDGVWEYKLWRRTWFGTPTDTHDGAEWILVYRVLGDGPTSIDTGVTDPWGIGRGAGKVRMRFMTVADGSPDSHTVLSNPTSALAAAAGQGVAFTDEEGNLHTPGADAGIYTPGSGGGAVDSVNGQTGTVTITAAGISAQPVDADLTAIAALTTTSFGRGLLELANAGAGLTALGAVPTTRTLNGLDLSANRTLPNNLRSHLIPAALGWAAADATPVRSIGNTRWLGSYVDYANASTPGHWIEWEVAPDAGTWTVTIFGDTLATNGTSTLKLDGVSIGTVNQYSASTVVGVVWEITGIVVASNGTHTFRAENTAAGVGAGTYNARFSAFQWRRTA